MTPSLEPIVCTLGPHDAEAQALEWVDLQRIARHAVPLPNGARMTFPLDQSARISDLAEREATCCGFLAITTAPDGDDFILEITSENPDAVGVIGSLSGVDLESRVADGGSQQQ